MRKGKPVWGDDEREAIARSGRKPWFVKRRVEEAHFRKSRRNLCESRRWGAMGYVNGSISHCERGLRLDWYPNGRLKVCKPVDFWKSCWSRRELLRELRVGRRLRRKLRELLVARVTISSKFDLESIRRGMNKETRPELEINVRAKNNFCRPDARVEKSAGRFHFLNQTQHDVNPRRRPLLRACRFEFFVRRKANAILK